MAKRKQQKKKDRERQVAQKKLATAAKKRALEKATRESQQTGKTKVMAAAVPKTDYVPANKRSPFAQQRNID